MAILDPASATERLCAHASIPIPHATTTNSGFSTTVDCVDLAEIVPLLEPLLCDILDCLEAVNSDWNGAPPSATPFASKTCGREVCLAVSEILHCGWAAAGCFELSSVRTEEMNTSQRHLVNVMWHISVAWNAILHGDFDNLREMLRNEALVVGRDYIGGT
ncbi:MAG: hypothetical protein HQ518_25885 [Rhodopirellula sp.]|nr:hypothetical protein [Rhodopirellula sp.]